MRVNPECVFFKNFRGKLFENGKRYAKFSTIPPFRAPLHFDWTKLAGAQIGYGAYNIRP